MKRGFGRVMAKLWERLHGYDNWIETVAIVEAADLKRKAHNRRDGSVSYTYRSLNTISWADESGAIHRATFSVPDDSPIYQLIDGDPVEIRYDPAQPDRFYYAELLRTRLTTLLQRIACTLLCLFLFWLFIALHIWLSH